MKKVICAVALALALAGCDSDEVKAAKELASAKEFIAQGDLPRAIVELRNALQDDETLTEARMLYGDLLLKRGRKTDAFAQYRYIVEKDPANLDATRAMAEIAFDAMAWKDAEKYTTVGLGLSATDPRLLALRAGLDYRAAGLAKNPDEMERAAVKAGQLLSQDPALIQARRVVLSDLMERHDLQGALKVVDAGLALDPKHRDLNNAKLVILGQLEDKPAIEKQILSMVSLYPDDENVGRLLVGFYLSTGRVDQAEAWLRDRIKPDSTDPDPRKAFLQFLAQLRSKEAMRDELTKVLAQTPLPKDVAADETGFRMMKSAVDFDLGDRDAAMSALEKLLEGAEPSEQIDKVKVQLAQMRLSAGNPVGARALVEEVLAHDPGQTGAIKLKSAWLIEEDKTQDAIRMLRDGLADAPQDSQLMVLLAGAYDRDGHPELVGDMLARAVEVSQQAPAESLRYAAWLVKKGEVANAEPVLIDALRRRPDNFDVLTMLAQVHLTMKDWPRATQDIASIRERFKTKQAEAVADELQAQLLQAQGQGDALNAFLSDLVQKTPEAIAPRVSIIRNMAAAGQLDMAQTQTRELIKEMPAAPEPQLLLAQILVAKGQQPQALSTLQALVAAHPDFAAGWSGLYGLQMGMGDKAAARATLDTAIKTLPENLDLKILLAGMFERAGDLEAAIAVYDPIYAKNSDNLVVANNLASLLSMSRSDPESLDRAWAVARRLNGSDVPAFQDTYGWIAFRKGDLTAALAALEPAAKGLPKEPAVAYHLAQTYAALNRKDEARAEYTRGADLIAGGAAAYPGLADQIAAGLAALDAK